MNNPQQNNFEEIQSLCRDFRRQLRSGAQKGIEDYLDRVYEDSREMLFQNLLHINIEYQRRQGHEPASDDYVARFPQHVRLIRQAFFESTMMSMSPEVETPADEDTVLFGMPAARKLGGYELQRELGRGGFGVVYQARHVQRGDIVALKTLPTNQDGNSHPLNDAERLHKFRREFRALSEINHPNLVGMQTLEVDGNQWFFTMDLLDGVDFLEYVRPGNRLDEQRLRSSLTQLVTGIMALHDHGIAHRDLKPGNVLVADNGHLFIMDFGLVAELQRQTDQTVSMRSRQFAGTPRYAAPEQSSGIRTTASDWYALGVILYEVLLGEPPYKGTNVDLIVKKQTEDAPRLAGHSDVPQDLALLVDQLLQREPDKRPAGHAIAEALGITIETHSHDSTDSSVSGLAGESATYLVGRESQLAALETARQELLQTQEPVVVFISGRSGEGKTSLAQKFLQHPRLSSDMIVLSGRCYDRESVPFKAIDCLIDALVAYLRSRSTDEVRSLLPDDIHMLTQIFPVLRRVAPIADRSGVNASGIDSRQIRYRAFAALRELLTTIGQSTPVILFIDDLQWGDADSAAALHEILLPPAAPAVMLLGSYRSDEADESPFLKEWRDRQPAGEGSIREQTLEVSPLTEEQCLTLFAARLECDSETVRQQAQDLFTGSRGNPYFLDQLIEGFDPAAGQFRAVPLVEIIERKFTRLPTEAGPLLDAIAVAGQAVLLSEVAAVVGQSGQAFATMTHMRSEHLVRLIGSGEQQRVDTYHDKIRETVLDGMKVSRRRDLHVRFGEYLEDLENVTAIQTLNYLNQDAANCDAEPSTTDRIFDLAYHFHAAGDSRGFAYQLMAGEQSFRAYASEDALAFLKRAEDRLPTDESDAIRYRLADRLGDSFIRLRQFEQALAAYTHAVKCAPSSLARARTHAGVARIYETLGRYTDATLNFDLALNEIGIQRPTNVVALLLSPWLVIRIFCLPARWQRTHHEYSIRLVGFQQDVFFELAIFLFDHNLPAPQYIYALLSQASLGIRSGESYRVARGFSYLAGHLAQAGFPAIGKRLVDRTASLTDELGNKETKGEYCLGAATARAMSRDVVHADRLFREATGLLKKSGTHALASVNSHLHRHLHSVIGSSGSELALAEDVLRLAEGVGDIRGQFWGNYDIASALARRGEVDLAKSRIVQAKACLGENRMHLSEAIFLATKGYVLLQASDYEAARESCEESWRLTKRRKLFLEYMVHALPWLIESIVGPDWTVPAKQSDRKRVRQLCRLNSFMYWFYPGLQSPIQRAKGRAFYALGKRRKAVHCFEKGVKCAASLGADYDRARSLLDLAAVRDAGRDENRSEAIQLLKQMDSVIPWAERWLLGDQFDQAVVAPDPGQPEIAAAK